jgi:polyisoprenoid-binding protein YceI
MKKTLLLGLLGLSLAASAAVLKTDPAKTTVSAVFKQMNVPVEAKFKKHNIVIDYNAAAPDASKATVEIETASLDVGDAEMNKEVAKKEWFNAAQFPKASFVSSAIKSAGAGKLNVTGKLTIKGKTADVTFPIKDRRCDLPHHRENRRRQAGLRWRAADQAPGFQCR